MVDRAEMAFSDDNVRASLKDVSWFNAVFLLDVHQNEPEPKLDDNIRQYPYHGFTDHTLAEYLRTPTTIREAGQSEFFKVRSHLSRGMVYLGGRPKPISEIAFSDEEIHDLVVLFGLPQDFTLDKKIQADPIHTLTCL